MSRKLVLELSFLTLEALTFFVLGAALDGAAGHEGMSFLPYLVAEAGGFFLVRGFLRVELPARLIMIAGGIVTLVSLVTIAGLEFDPSAFPPGWAGVRNFLGNPGAAAEAAQAPVMYGLILLTVVWCRGVWAAQERLERSRASRSFSLGLVVLTLALLFGHDSPARGAVNGASLPLVGFGLLTLALIHLRESRPATGEAPRGPWMLITASTVGGLVLGGGALGVLPLGPGGWLYDHAIAPVLSLIVLVITWALIAIAFPFAWLISLILNRLLGGQQFKPPRPPQVTASNDNGLLTDRAKGHTAGIFVVLAKLIIIIAVLALIAYIAYRLFKRLHRPPVEDEERESLAGEGSLRGDLAGLWRHLLPRRRSPSSEAEPDLPQGVLQARRLYVRLLRLTAAHGHPRPEGATPFEFEPEAERALASAVPLDVTDTFVAARYGRQEPSAAELRRLQEAIDRLA